jgi:AbrB family looped-hinge helix DNA binding protein
MAKVTTKLQVTIPKSIADKHAIRPGDDVEWVSAGDTIRVIPAAAKVDRTSSIGDRLRWYDQATKRQEERQGICPVPQREQTRGWTREDLYPHGGTG